MRTQTLAVLSVVAVCSGCATLGGGGSTGKFQGKDVVEARVKELQGKLNVAEECGKESPPLGLIEVTAKADGKIVARSFDWKGKPEVAACVVDAAQKLTVAPLAGPSVSAIWWYLPNGATQPTPPTSPKGDVGGMQTRLQPEVEACAQRYLPNDFGCDIDISYFVLSNGKVIAPTVTSSTARDGDYETCVQNLIGAKTFPETGFDGPFPMKFHFHVGPLDKI